MRLFTLMVGLAGCASPGLVSDASLGEHPMLRSLPAHVSVVGGSSSSALGVDALLSLVGSGLPSVDALVVGCGDHGCVALAEGVDGALLANGRSVELAGRLRPSKRARASQLRVVDLGDDKWVVGNGRAVSDQLAVWRRELGAPQGALHDPSWLTGLVPDGGAWLAARTPQVLVAQAFDVGDRVGVRLTADPSQEASVHELAAQVAHYVDAVAVALVADAAGDAETRVVVRVRAVNARAAQQLALVARVQLDRTSLPAWVLAHQLVRDGDRVELVLDVDGPAARAALAVQP